MSEKKRQRIIKDIVTVDQAVKAERMLNQATMM